MDKADETAAAAQRHAAEYDEEALLVLLGKQHKAIQRNPALKDDPTLDPPYDEAHMDVIDDLKAAGRRIAEKWNKELHSLVCGGGINEERDKLIEALNIGQAAAIGKRDCAALCGEA
jgi:hypothetical protein